MKLSVWLTLAFMSVTCFAREKFDANLDIKDGESVGVAEVKFTDVLTAYRDHKTTDAQVLLTDLKQEFPDKLKTEIDYLAIRIDGQTSETQAIEHAETFIRDNPDSEFTPTVKYLAGVYHRRLFMYSGLTQEESEDYTKMLDYFNQFVLDTNNLSGVADGSDLKYHRAQVYLFVGDWESCGKESVEFWSSPTQVEKLKPLVAEWVIEASKHNVKSVDDVSLLSAITFLESLKK